MGWFNHQVDKFLDVDTDDWWYNDFCWSRFCWVFYILTGPTMETDALQGGLDGLSGIPLSHGGVFACIFFRSSAR